MPIKKNYQDQLKIIADLIKQKRVSVGYTQGDLAKSTGLGFRTIQRIESGKYWPGLKQLVIVFNELKINFSFH